jgi:hypothetical protein
MALRDKLHRAVEPHLQPGETIQAVFPAQTTSQYMALISYWIILFRKAYRVVAATDRRIIVFQCGRWSFATIESIAFQAPRQTLIGPAKGLWYRFESLGTPLYVHKRFHKDVAAADAWSSSVV